MTAAFGEFRSLVGIGVVADSSLTKPGELKPVKGGVEIVDLCKAMVGVLSVAEDEPSSFVGVGDDARDKCCFRLGGGLSCMLTGLLTSAS